MNHTVLFLILLAFFSPAASQSFKLQWAANPGMDNRSRAKGAAMDANGNYYVTGFLSGTGNFNTQGGVDQLSTTGGSQGADFLWKLDSAGHAMWARQWITTIISEYWGGDVVTDLAGDVYISGYFSGVLDADPGPNQLLFHADATGLGVFIIKLDSSGNLIWARNLPGNVHLEDLAVDHGDRLVIAGSFQGTADLDPGPAVYAMNNYRDSTLSAFVSVWNAAGDFIWARQVESKAHSFAYAVCVDHHDNILVTGEFSGSGGQIETDFDPGPNQVLVNSMFLDAFVWKLDRDGQFIWAVPFSGDPPPAATFTQAHGTDIQVDAADDPIILGEFYSGRIDMDPGFAVNYLYSNGENDVFIAKLDPAGRFIWAKGVGGYGYDQGSSLALDMSGNIYFSGSFEFDMDADPGSGSTILKAGVSRDVYLNQLTPSGDYISSVSEGSYGATDSSYGNAVLTYRNSVFLAGGFGHRMDADPGAGVRDLVSTSAQDIFVQKLKPCATYQDLTVHSCGPYTINDTTYTVSGDYQLELVNVAGCDSTLIIHLTVQTMNLPKLGADRSLCAGDVVQLDPGPFASYSWQDGSTQRTRQVSTAGKFFVKVTDSAGCTATDTLVIKGIVPPLHGFLPRDTAMCVYDQLIIRPTETFSQYVWSDGTTAPLLEVKKSGVYWLEATDANGCAGRDSIFIGNKECPTGVHVPSAFTPNGDGLNDHFHPIIWGSVSSYLLRIFDRWGDLVFQTSDRDASWDGTFKGQPVPTGNLTWVCSFSLNGAPVRTEKGTILLIR